MQFQRATLEHSKLRLALIGPSGSGKTYSGLSIASGFSSRIAVIDTERGSARKYSDRFTFDVLELESFEPSTYIKAIQAADAAGYDVLLIDSLSHAWIGRGGALDQVDKAAKRSQTGNSFAAWRDVTPQHNALVDAILGARCHIIVTMRAKTEYVQEKDEKGKTVIRKVGLAPVQRDGLEYEFDVVGDMDYQHNLIVSKTRYEGIDGAVIHCPGPDLAMALRDWLQGGTEPASKVSTVQLTAEEEAEKQALIQQIEAAGLARCGGDANAWAGRRDRGLAQQGLKWLGEKSITGLRKTLAGLVAQQQVAETASEQITGEEVEVLITDIEKAGQRLYGYQWSVERQKIFVAEMGADSWEQIDAIRLSEIRNDLVAKAEGVAA